VVRKRETSEFRTQFACLTEIDIQFPSLSEFDIEHTNFFSLGVSHPFSSISLFLIFFLNTGPWERQECPYLILKREWIDPRPPLSASRRSPLSCSPRSLFSVTRGTKSSPAPASSSPTAGAPAAARPTAARPTSGISAAPDRRLRTSPANAWPCTAADRGAPAPRELGPATAPWTPSARRTSAGPRRCLRRAPEGSPWTPPDEPAPGRRRPWPLAGLAERAPGQVVGLLLCW